MVQCVKDFWQIHNFRIDGYINNGGGKMVFMREDWITKRLENLETKPSETIWLKLTVSNKNDL